MGKSGRLDPGFIPIAGMAVVLVLMNLLMAWDLQLRSAVIVAILGALYVVGVPVVGLLTVGASIFRAFLHELSWGVAFTQIVAVALLGAFWGWSIENPLPWVRG